jgi:hypothetical protein
MPIGWQAGLDPQPSWTLGKEKNTVFLPVIERQSLVFIVL